MSAFRPDTEAFQVVVRVQKVNGDGIDELSYDEMKPAALGLGSLFALITLGILSHSIILLRKDWTVN